MSLLQLAFFVKYHVAEVISLHLVYYCSHEYWFYCPAPFLYEPSRTRDTEDSILPDGNGIVPVWIQYICADYIFCQKNLLPRRRLRHDDECEPQTGYPHHTRWTCDDIFTLSRYTRTTTHRDDMGNARLSRSHDAGYGLTHTLWKNLLPSFSLSSSLRVSPT